MTGILPCSPCLEVSTSVLSSEVVCPESWRRLDGHCYSLLTGYHEMEVCRADCHHLGGDLASVHSRRENEFLADLIRNRPVRGGEKVRRERAQWGGKYSPCLGYLDSRPDN